MGTDGEPEKTGRNHAGRWQPGHSGNPAGKPRGSRHRATQAALELLEAETEAITRVAIENALSGDMAAVKLIFERLIPVAKDTPVQFEAPKLESAGDLPGAVAAILEAVSTGNITISDGARLAGMLRDMAAALEAHEFERRLTELENRHNANH